MKAHSLSANVSFDNYSFLVLNHRGRYLEPMADLREFSDALEIKPNDLPGFFQKFIVLPADVTDVFVWVHGWRNGIDEAVASARRLFASIVELARSRGRVYPLLSEFRPAFVAVHWPSMSRPGPIGYRRIRDRARKLTDEGEAEFFLASLLGYLEVKNARVEGIGSKVLRARGGFSVHCIGHSFGGRFLVAALRAAAAPKSPKTLGLMKDVGMASRRVLSAGTDERFEFTADSMMIFQMAAPAKSYSSELQLLVTSSPLSGPVVLTHSRKDRANCLWHRAAEWGQPGIGCRGAKEPSREIQAIRLKELDKSYSVKDFNSRIVNVDATWAFRKAWLRVEGAHSDFWYAESIHLLLSLVNLLRAR